MTLAVPRQRLPWPRCSVLGLHRQGREAEFACAPFVASAPPRRSSATAAVAGDPVTTSLPGVLCPFDAPAGRHLPAAVPIPRFDPGPDRAVAGVDLVPDVAARPGFIEKSRDFSSSSRLACPACPVCSNLAASLGFALQSLTVLAPARPSSMSPSSAMPALPFLCRRAEPIRKRFGAVVGLQAHGDRVARTVAASRADL